MSTEKEKEKEKEKEVDIPFVEKNIEKKKKVGGDADADDDDAGDDDERNFEELTEEEKLAVMTLWYRVEVEVEEEVEEDKNLVKVKNENEKCSSKSCCEEERKKSFSCCGSGKSGCCSRSSRKCGGGGKEDREREVELEEMVVVVDSQANLTPTKNNLDPKVHKSLIVVVGGMTCSGCATKVEKLLSNVNGIKSFWVNFISQKATMVYAYKQITEDEIANKIKSLGFTTEVIQELKKGEMLFCYKESKNCQPLKEWFSANSSSKEGIEKVKLLTFDKKKKVFKVSFEEQETCPRKIIKQILKDTDISVDVHSKGFESLQESLLRKKEIRYYGIMFFVSLIFTLPAIVVALILGNIPPLNVDDDGNGVWLSYSIFRTITPKSIMLFVFCSPVQFIFGYTFYKKGIKALLVNKSPDKNTLITVSCWVAYIVSIISVVYGLIDENYKGRDYLEGSAVLISFLLLGQWLENIANSKTSISLIKLLNLQPKKARIIEFTEEQSKQVISQLVKDKEVLKEEEIIIDLVWKNDILKVNPGETVPTDGIVVYGESLINQSMMTGESVPVAIKQKSEVIGGTLNLDGTFFMKVTKGSSDNMLSKMITYIESAQLNKPKLQDVIDQVAKWFVPVIITISILVLFIWIILAYCVIKTEWMKGTNEVLFAVLHATSTLVIACPCTLGLAVPLVILVANGIGAKLGILIKGGGCFELLEKISIVGFDKTGTLTKGELEICDFIILDSKWSGEKKEKELLEAIAVCENCIKSHPIARTIISYTKEKLSVEQFSNPEKFENVNGKGIRCTYNGEEFVVGSQSFMILEDVNIDSLSKKEVQQKMEGRTLVFVAQNKKLLAVLCLIDQVKPEAKNVIAEIRKKKMRVILLTGDNKSVAKKIGIEVGIKEEDIFAELTPFGKTEIIKTLQNQFQSKSKEKNKVLFVGDGLNDSIALTQSDVGISMASGTEIAMECSDIVLMKHSLKGILLSFDLAKKAFVRIKWNVFWAFFYNVVSVPFAAGLLFPLIKEIVPTWMCAILMTFSCLSVTVNTIFFGVFYRAKK